MQNSEVMPQRILKPAWEGIKSPITLKGLLLFLAVAFIAYTVVKDEQARQASEARFKILAKYTEESQVAIEGAKQNNEITKQNLEQTKETLKLMGEIRSSISDVAEILKLNRVANASEHRALYNVIPERRVSEVSRTRGRLKEPCYELRPIEKKYGNSSVIVNTLIETKCP